MKRCADLFALVILCLLIGCTSSQKSLLKGVIPENSNQYQADFLDLAKYVLKTHAGFYSNPMQSMSFVEYDLIVDQVYEDLRYIESEEEFYIKLQWFVARLNDGHTRINYSSNQRAEISAWWVDGKLIIVNAPENLNEMMYAEISEIGGLAVSEYETRINDFISADRGHLRFKRLFSPEYMLSKEYLKYFGLLNSETSFKVKYIIQDKVVERDIRLISSNQYYSTINLGKNDITNFKNRNWYTAIENDLAFYVQLNSLPSSGYSEFWEAVFKEIKNKGIRSLIIDLRNNGGGNSVWCNEFLSYIVDSTKKLFIYKGWRSDYPYGNQETSNGILEVKPVQNGLNFNGRLIILTSLRTFSSATFFVVAVKDNGLGTIIGEPVGNASIRYGYMADPVILKNTNLKFATTKYIWGRAKPNLDYSTEVYIMPDEEVELKVEDVKKRYDRVFERSLEVIRGYK